MLQSYPEALRAYIEKKERTSLTQLIVFVALFRLDQEKAIL